MITQTPTDADFRDAGISYINLAWDAAINLLLDIDESGIAEYDDDKAIADDYWHRAQRPLSTALPLAQQGAELLMKARIASVSPYLLLSGTPRDWPKGCEQSDCAYAEFRTLDAQDLPRVHETVSPERLSDEFKSQFDRMRKIRNSLVHTVSKGQRFSAADVLKWILSIWTEFLPTRRWMAERFEYLERASPGGAFPSEYGYEQRVARELRAILDALTPAESQKFFKINKKVRFYYCLTCHISDFGLDNHVKTAQLKPNTPTSTTLHCHACDCPVTVLRMGCQSCPGNVVDEESATCLSCGNRMEYGPQPPFFWPGTPPQ